MTVKLIYQLQSQLNKLKDGSDFILEHEIRHLVNMNDDIHIHFIRLSETIKPFYKEIYPYQNTSNEEYTMDMSIVPNVFSKNIRGYHSKFENATIFDYEADNRSILLDQLNVTYSSKDFVNIFYKVNYNMHSINQSSLINERFINVMREYAHEKALYVEATNSTLSNIRKTFRDKIHTTLLSDYINNQRNIAFYITDYQDEEINMLIEEIFSDVKAPYFESQSILFIHKPKKINYDKFLRTIANPSEDIWFQSIYTPTDCKERYDITSSLTRTIYHLIPARSSLKYSIVTSLLKKWGNY